MLGFDMLNYIVEKEFYSVHTSPSEESAGGNNDFE